MGERVDGVINTNLNDGRRGQRAKPASVYGTRGGEEQGVRGGGESRRSAVRGIDPPLEPQKKKEDYSLLLLCC